VVDGRVSVLLGRWVSVVGWGGGVDWGSVGAGFWVSGASPPQILSVFFIFSPPFFSFFTCLFLGGGGFWGWVGLGGLCLWVGWFVVFLVGGGGGGFFCVGLSVVAGRFSFDLYFLIMITPSPLTSWAFSAP